MSLNAKGTSYSTQQLQGFLKQREDKLPAGETLRLSGENISLQELQQQCKNHPALEELVQQFIQTQDQMQLSGATQSMEFPQQAQFNASPDSAEQPADTLGQNFATYQRLQTEIQDLKQTIRTLAVSNSPATRAKINDLGQQIQARQLQLQPLDRSMRQLALQKGYELVDPQMSDPSKWSQLEPNNQVNKILQTLGEQAGQGVNNHLMEFGKNLALTEGDNFLYAMAISKGLNGDQETQARLAGVLTRCQQELGGLNADDNRLLSQAGLHVRDGKLYNLLTQQEVSSATLGKLSETVKAFSEAAQKPYDPESKALMHLRGILTNSLNQSAALNESAATLDGKIQALDKALDEYQASQDELSAGNQAFSRTQSELATLEHKIKAIKAVMAFDRAGKRPVPDPEPTASLGTAQPLSPGTPAAGLDASLSEADIRTINENLQVIGENQGTLLSVSRTADGGLSYTKDRQIIGAEIFQAELRAEATKLHGEFTDLSQTATAQNAEVTRLRKATEEASQNVDKAKTDADVAQFNFDIQAENASQVSKASSEELAEMQQDPAAARALARLSPEVLSTVNASRQGLEKQSRPAQYRTLSQRREAANARREKLNARNTAAIRDSRALQAEFPHKLSRVKRASLLLDYFLKHGDEIGKAAAKAVKPESIEQLAVRHQEEKLQAQVEAMVEEADRLQAQLQLAQAPVFKNLEQIDSDLEKLLNQVQTSFQEIHTDNADRQMFQQQATQNHSERIQDNTAYHARKLRELRSQGLEARARAAAEALRQLRGDLFVMRSLQTA